MLTRKETRKKARESIRGHYWIFMLACILAAILGTDFGNSLDIFRVTRTEKGEAFLNVGRNSIFVPSTQGESSLWGYIVSGDWQGAKEAVDERFDLLTGEDSYVGVVELGHSRGILASVVNIFSSGALMMAILSVVDLILGSRTAAVVIFSVVSLAIVFFIWLFLINTYQVILKRVFLEGRIYKQVPVARLSYLYRIRRWWQVSAGMLVYKALSFLWMLTVVIYPIKRYAYLLVPYILAENPDVAPMEAIRLSARMMEGHKKEAFLLELTLLPWDILSFISGGVTGIFFSNAYSEAVFAEYYAQVRGEAVKNQVDGVEKLIDRYLFELPDHELMQEAYKDVITLREAPPKPLPSCHPGRLIAENIFGLVPRLDERERCFRAGLKQQIQLEEYEGILAGETYPTRLYILKEREGKRERRISSALLCTGIYPDVFYFLLYRLVMGRDRRFFTAWHHDQSRGAAWTLASDLRGRRADGHLFAEPLSQVSPGGIWSYRPSLRNGRIFHLPYPGAGAWPALVGLQWILPEPERPDLCGRTAGIRHWRYGDCLYPGSYD